MPWLDPDPLTPPEETVAANTRHPVYPGGPPCDWKCPGIWTSFHDGYAAGYDYAKPNDPLNLEKMRLHLHRVHVLCAPCQRYAAAIADLTL